MRKPPKKIEDERVQARLNAKIPKEYAALAVLHQWLDQGYSQREILTHALLALGDEPYPPERVPVSPSELREAIYAAQREYVETVAQLLDERFDELSRLAPAERKQRFRETAGSSLASSVANSVEVTEYNGESYEGEG